MAQIGSDNQNDEQFKQKLSQWKITGIDTKIDIFVEQRSFLVGIAEQNNKDVLKNFADEQGLTKVAQEQFGFHMIQQFYKKPKDYLLDIYFLFFSKNDGTLKRTLNSFLISTDIDFEEFTTLMKNCLMSHIDADLDVDYRMYRPIHDKTVDNVTKGKGKTEYKVPDQAEIIQILNISSLQALFKANFHDVIVCINLAKFREKVAPSSWTDNDLNNLNVSFKDVQEPEQIISSYTKNNSFSKDIQQFHDFMDMQDKEDDKNKKKKSSKAKNEENNEDKKPSKYASTIKVILDYITLYPNNEKLVDTFMILLLAEMDFFTKSILTMPQFSLKLSMSFRETQCHCDFMVDTGNEKKERRGLLCAIVEDKSHNHLKSKDDIKDSGEAEATAYGIAMSQMMDSETKWKTALKDQKRRFSESGFTFMSPGKKKFRSNMDSSDDTNENKHDNNVDNNDNDNKKLQLSHEESYIVLVRVIGYLFTFYRMPHDINLSRRCWGVEDTNTTEILRFRRQSPLDFKNTSDREIILKLFLSIRDEIKLVSN